MFYLKTRKAVTSLSLGVLMGGISLLLPGSLLAGETQGTMIHKTGMPHQESPEWAEKLKGQTIVEDAMEGRAERAAQVEQQHQRMMQQMQTEHGPQGGRHGGVRFHVDDSSIWRRAPRMACWRVKPASNRCP